MRDFNYYKNKKNIDEEGYTHDWQDYASTPHLWISFNKNEELDPLFHKKNFLLTKSWVVVTADKNIKSKKELEFDQLAEKWKNETGLYSTTQQKINDTFLDILVMGPTIVPFILKDLQNNGPAHWHAALKALTKENPVSENDLSKNKLIRAAWIEWGKSKQLI